MFPLQSTGTIEKNFREFGGTERRRYEKSFGAAKEAFDKLGTSFNQHAAYHAKMKEACEKADAADDLNKLQPSAVSAVYDPSKGIRR